jgi:hypothetical protein
MFFRRRQKQDAAAEREPSPAMKELIAKASRLPADAPQMTPLERRAIQEWMKPHANALAEAMFPPMERPIFFDEAQWEQQQAELRAMADPPYHVLSARDPETYPPVDEVVVTAHQMPSQRVVKSPLANAACASAPPSPPSHASTDHPLS